MREEIRQQAEEYRQPYRDGGYHLSSKDIREAFEEGAEWMQKKMIEKACDCIIKIHNWPTQYEEFAKFQEEFIKEFRKAMED